MNTKRLEILQNSLLKKQSHFEDRLIAHRKDVLSANGQPLNDKRNGHVTLRRWEKQDQTLQNIDKSIELTKRAIEKEKNKIEDCNAVKEVLPQCFLDLMSNGTLKQWRKHPETFFVDGVERGRIVWDKKKKEVFTRYIRDIPTEDQRAKFVDVRNNIIEQIRKN